jgi:hypothetical protein
MTHDRMYVFWCGLNIFLHASQNGHLLKMNVHSLMTIIQVMKYWGIASSTKVRSSCKRFHSKTLYLGKDFEAKNLSKSVNKGMLLGAMIVNVLHSEQWHEILGGYESHHSFN